MKNKVLKTIGYIVGITWLFTAQLLLDGVEESMGATPDKWGIIPPEHSKASMIRRCVQARQEILQVQKALEEGRCNDG